MQELAAERRAVQAVLSDYRMYGWLWEDDAGARPTPIRTTFLKAVETCDIYLGLFWLGYGPYTIEEYEHARQQGKPCLIYKKQIDTDQRDPHLTDFLKQIEDVRNPNGLTVRWFTTTEELAAYVQEDVLRLLVDKFRESRLQPVNTMAINRTTGKTLSTQEQIELTGLLLKCTAMSNEGQRDVVIGLLPPYIVTRISHERTAIIHVLQIVKKCQDFEGGIEQLAQATRTIEGDTNSAQAVMAFLQERSFLV